VTSKESPIQISLLLVATQRNVAAKQQAEKLCQQIGLEVLSSGLTSLCCQLSAKQFHHLFGVK
jgi:hypothetical protein